MKKSKKSKKKSKKSKTTPRRKRYLMKFFNLRLIEKARWEKK